MRRKIVTVLAAGAATAALVGLAVAPAGAARAHSTTITITVTAGKPSEYKFTVSQRSFKKGAVLFRITNKGKVSHSFEVCSSNQGGSVDLCSGEPTRPLAPGKSTTLLFSFTRKGKYEYLDTIPGHAKLGMKGILTVT